MTGTSDPDDRVRLRGIHNDLALRPWPYPPRDVVRAHLNEAPFAPPEAIVEALTSFVQHLNRYADFAPDVEVKLASKLGLTPDKVYVGAGSFSILHTLLTATCDPGDEVVYPWRTYEGYLSLFSVGAITPVAVPTLSDGRADIEAMIRVIGPRTRVILMCSPNNPSGTVTTATEFEALMARVPRDVLVVLDEAYAEFVTDLDAVKGLEHVRRHPNLVLARTFSKAYGLAGLRIGYLVGRPYLVERVRQLGIANGVSSLSRVAVNAALEARAQGEVARRVSLLVKERGRIRRSLIAMGLDVPVSQGSFIWLPLGPSAEELGSHVVDHGIAVRVFAPDGLRYSILTPKLNDRFLGLVEEWLDLRDAAGAMTSEIAASAGDPPPAEHGRGRGRASVRQETHSSRL